MTPTSVTISSVGTSSPIQLDPYSGRATFITVSGQSSGTFTASLQVTLDLPSVASPVWVSDQNFTSQSSAFVAVYNGSPSQIRLNVSAISSNSLVLKCAQGLAG